MEEATQNRVVCPECESTETERIDISEGGSITDSGTTLEEVRSCQNCYAGYTIKYGAQSVETTTPPQGN